MTDTQNEKRNVSFVNLYKQDGKDDCFYWEKDWLYFYMFPTSEEWKYKQVYYWVVCFNNKENFDKRRAWERVDGDIFFWIWQRESKKNPNNTWLWWILSNKSTKKAYFVSLKDNTFKKEWRNHDKYLQLTETEFREKKEVDTSLPREWETTEEKKDDVL